MIIVEYVLDHPILRSARTAVPGIEIAWENSHVGAQRERQFLAWVECEDFGSFEAALGADPTVTDTELITETDGRRLYRFPLSEEGRRLDMMPLLMDLGTVPQDLVATAEGWECTVRCPDRASLERIDRFCRDNGIGLRIDRLWEAADGGEGASSTLTDPQRETLLRAAESGYLDVPRSRSLAELGADLGVSESAASERFRRGVKALIKDALE